MAQKKSYAWRNGYMDAIMKRPKQSPWRDIMRSIGYANGFEAGMIALRQGKGSLLFAGDAR